MKLIVLVAGFAVRLYPLTVDRPKALLPIARRGEAVGRPLIEYVVEHVACVPDFDRVYVVTNARFAPVFAAWGTRYFQSATLRQWTLVDDGVTREEERRGAIGDLALTLEREGIEDDVVVVAGDNLFGEPLRGFAGFCREKNAPVLGVYDVGDLEAVKKYNALQHTADGRITGFEEKPSHPTSTVTGVALYYYPRWVLPKVREYLAAGNNPDQPGRLVQWLYPKTACYVWRVPGIWFDIGSHESYVAAGRAFGMQ
jgi:glucose-1-phosphate thymidylyltransferase